MQHENRGRGNRGRGAGRGGYNSNYEQSNGGRGRGAYRGGRGGSRNHDDDQRKENQNLPNPDGRDDRSMNRGRGGNRGGNRRDGDRNDMKTGEGSFRDDRGRYRGRGDNNRGRDREDGVRNYYGRGTEQNNGNTTDNRRESSGSGFSNHQSREFSKSEKQVDSKENPVAMNQNSRLAVNIFGLKLAERTIFRHIIQMKLLDSKTKKDYILTTMSARGRGNRATKQKDNFILLGILLAKFAEKKNAKNIPVFAYDGAQTLFTLEGISHSMTIPMEEAMLIPNISCFLQDSIKYLKGDLEISCEPDFEKPSFVQTVLDEWSDSRFYQYLDIVTSQSAIRNGKYLSQSKGLYVNTQFTETFRVKWAVAAKGVHKGCRIVGGASGPLPILELDPQSTQYYASIPLSEMIMYAFPRDFTQNPVVNPNMRLQRAVRLLLKDLKCNPFYEDLNDWATNTITISDVDYNAPRDAAFTEKYKNLKYPYLPAAQCGMGQHKRTMPLEYLKVLPFQSIDRRVLEEFDLTPRANAPNERWSTLQTHFELFGFNDQVMSDFGVEICNDPFSNISEIDSERVTAPKIAYAEPVHVDDEKRDWKAQDKKFVSPAKIDLLMIALVSGYSRNFDAEKRATRFLAEAFIQRCKDKGIIVGKYECQAHEGERNSENFMTSVFKNLVKHPRYSDSSFTPFVLFISDDVPNIHECLKFEERMSDIPTQHILLKNVRKIRDNMEKKSQGGRRAYDLTLDNIVMKANVKCGGLNYTADVPQDIACWKEVPTFVMGMDVAHPDKMASREGNPSTVGLSCNSAENPYSFIGDFHYTDPRKEAIQDEILKRFTDQSVRTFAELRGFPKKIIIFRDGVSFGEETEAMREVEIIEKTIIDAAHSMGLRDYAPKVLAIVVKKRHHTRFYAKGGYQGNVPTNPLPDTSVGGEIAEFGKRQIFIQAFRPVQGTAKVPSFLIIRDDEDVPDEHIAKMVCAVCSLHQIVNSPTSLPTPVYVAHELAKRGTGLFKAYRFKQGDLRDDWMNLTNQLSYSTLDRLSKVRVV